MDERIPYNLDAEESVLGSLLIDPAALYELPDLRPEHFYISKNQALFRVISQMIRDGVNPDLVTVPENWPHDTVDFDPGWFVGLISAVPTSTGVTKYGRIVWEHHKRREIINMASSIAEAAYKTSTSLSKVIEMASTGLLDVSLDETTSDVQSAKKVASEAVDGILARHEAGGRMMGLATGYSVLDDKLRGLQGGQVYILAARPGMGKTALATDIVANLCQGGSHVLFYSLEMQATGVITRMISQHAKLPYNTVNEGSWVTEGETKAVMGAAGQVSEYELSIDDTPAITVSQVYAKAQRHIAQHGKLDLIVLDYLQLMGTDGQHSNMVTAVSEMSIGLTSLSKRLDIPVLVVAQLSRAVEKRADMHPILSDLRDSGQIEQDASVVLFIYRADYYMEVDGEDVIEGLVDLDVAKNRYGEEGRVELHYNKPYGHFSALGPRTHYEL